MKSEPGMKSETQSVLAPDREQDALRNKTREPATAEMAEGILGWTKGVADKALDLLRDRSLSHSAAAYSPRQLGMKLSVGLHDMVRRRSKDDVQRSHGAIDRPTSMMVRRALTPDSSADTPEVDKNVGARRMSTCDDGALVFWRERCGHLEAQVSEVEARLEENTRACSALQQQMEMENKRQSRGTGISVLKTMTCEDVHGLLRRAHLEQYAQRFQEKNINGHALAAINESVLEDALQVKNRFHRMKIMQLSKGNMGLMTL